jgi:hypothetical protein
MMSRMAAGNVLACRPGPQSLELVSAKPRSVLDDFDSLGRR